jgi:isoquinoline 1-oxidoreductase beta subunit
MTYIERYLRSEKPGAEPKAEARIENVSRRRMLQGVAAAGGLVLTMPMLSGRAGAAFPLHYNTGGPAMPHGTVNDPRVFVSIAPDGTVTIVAARAEMGTGAARTSLPMIIADELGADWGRCSIVQAPGDEAKYGNQDTDGSRSVRHWLIPLRQVGAAARTMLEQAAAQRWNVPVDQVKAGVHEVTNTATGEKLGYGDLADAAAKLAVPAADTLKLKDPSEFRYMTKGNVGLVDLRPITVGTATYGADVRLPGMKYAVIARPPVVGGKLVSFDPKDALAVPGVEQVVEVQGWPWPSKFQPLGGVAVIARNTGAAIKGRDALKIVWDDGANAKYDSDTYREELLKAVRGPGEVIRNDGDAPAALEVADKVIVGEYYLPHLAQAPMEPPVATAWVRDGKAEIWAPVQSPGGTHEDVAKTLNMPAENVKVNVTLLGGGFGRKSKCDYALEAALLSQKLGVPVRVQWTREDDIKHSFYHTVSAERIEAGIDKNGKVVAWRHRSAAPSIFSTFKPNQVHQAALEYSMGFTANPFDIPNFRCENPEAAAHTRIGWFRSVSNIPHGFAEQSMVAEIAAALGRDPKDMLLELIGPARTVDLSKSVKDLWNYGEPLDSYPIDAGRLRAVVEMVADKAGWGRQVPKGHGLGIAAHRSFVSYIATVVEVAVDDKGNLTVPRVDTVVDCGTYVNPERIRSQYEGAAVMGLSLAKHGEITFKNGRVEQSNWDDYKVLRIDESPTITNVYIMPPGADTPPSGAGEPGVPPFAPALVNAIFAATGKRIRHMPIHDQLTT